MMEKILTCSIRAICVGAMALGMTTAMARDAAVVMQDAGVVDRERLAVVAYSDPEGEVGNGMEPPRREANSRTEAGDDLDVPMEVDNFPEGEVGNGTNPPRVNPMAQGTSALLQHVDAMYDERLIVVAYSDPEGEVGNGIDPPMEINNFPETEVGNGMDPPIEINNFPEGEVTNGTDPPK